jgi:hypothetical protein
VATKEKEWVEKVWPRRGTARPGKEMVATTPTIKDAVS